MAAYSRTSLILEEPSDYMMLPPNWESPVKMTYTYNTGIITTMTGIEQRTIYHYKPRRKLSFQVRVMSLEELNYLQNFLFVNANKTIGVPVWSQPIRITAQFNPFDWDIYVNYEELESSDLNLFMSGSNLSSGMNGFIIPSTLVWSSYDATVRAQAEYDTYNNTAYLTAITDGDVSPLTQSHAIGEYLYPLLVGVLDTGIQVQMNSAIYGDYELAITERWLTWDSNWSLT